MNDDLMSKWRRGKERHVLCHPIRMNMSAAGCVKYDKDLSEGSIIDRVAKAATNIVGRRQFKQDHQRKKFFMRTRRRKRASTRQKASWRGESRRRRTCQLPRLTFTNSTDIWNAENYASSGTFFRCRQSIFGPGTTQAQTDQSTSTESRSNADD